MSVVTATNRGNGLLQAYAQHQDLLGGSPSYRRSRVHAAEGFLAVHPDLAAWMAGPLDARLAELRRRPLVWPLVGFALLTGRGRAEADFLFAKKFGHSMARWTAALFPEDVRRLADAAERLGMTIASTPPLLREDLPLAVAFSGQPLSHLTEETLDALGEAIATTTRLTGPMRRRRRAGLFGLRRLLFEARILDRPPVHRREGGPATRQARMATVQAPEIRQTIVTYLDARSVVLRPKTIEKRTSALAIFGEFLSERFPELTTLAALKRHHVEAFLTWTATRSWRRPQDGHRLVGPFVTAHAVIALRGFLEDIAAWGWAQAPPRRLVFATDIPRQPETLPRALPPDVDTALTAAVAELNDEFA
jgi:hypothetical protein